MSKYNDLAKAVMDEIERCNLAREPILLSAIEAVCERYVGGDSRPVNHDCADRVDGTFIAANISGVELIGFKGDLMFDGAMIHSDLCTNDSKD